MILPTKGILPRQALLALGADILRLLTEAMTVSRLWDEFRRREDRGVTVTFDWFILALDLLFALDAVELDRERVRRRTALVRPTPVAR
jgi:hypothetical protein